MTIDSSPYYRSDRNSLPSGDTVQQGVFYLADDGSSGVSAMYTNAALPATQSKSAETGQTLLHLHDDLQNCTINGYAKVEGGYAKSLHAIRMTIHVGEEVDSLPAVDPHNAAGSFMIEIDGEVGYLYSIPPEGKDQLKFVHYLPYPVIGTDGTTLETAANGGVYLQFQGSVYKCEVKTGGSHIVIGLDPTKEAVHYADEQLYADYNTNTGAAQG